MISILRPHRILALTLLVGCGKSGESEENKGKAALEITTFKVKIKQPEAKRLVLRQVLVRKTSVDPRWDVDATKLAAKIEASLQQMNAVVATADDVAAGYTAVRVELQVNLRSLVDLPSARAEGRMVVALEASVFVIGGKMNLEPSSAIMVELPISDKEVPEVAQLLQIAISDAANRLTESLAAQSGLLRASQETIIDAMSKGDQSLRVWAMQVAAERKLGDAVVPLISILQSSNEEMSGQAMTSLVAIGDPRAVSALAGLADFKDYEELATIMEAVSAIGGTDAVEFLEFVASGHPSEDLRKRASQSVERIERAERVMP